MIGSLVSRSISADTLTSLETLGSEVTSHVSRALAVSVQQMEVFVERSVQSSAHAIASHVEKTVELSRRRTIDEMDDRLGVLQNTVVGAMHGSRAPRNPPPSRKGAEGAAPWASIVRQIANRHHRVFQCKPGCQCSCHFISSYSLSLSSLQSVLGSIAIAYNGSSIGNSASGVCPKCGTRRHRSVRIVYNFPSWIVRASLAVFCSTNLNGVPQMNIRVANQLLVESPAYAAGLFGRARSNDIEGVKQVLRRGESSVFDMDPNGHTALTLAVSCGRYEVAKILIAEGADPFHEAPGYGVSMSPAGIAFRKFSLARDLEKFTDLFGSASVTAFVEHVGYTPLHLALLEILHFDVVDALRKPEYAAMIEQASGSYTPLTTAILMGNMAAVQALIRLGAKTKVPTKQISPLHRACSLGNSFEIARVLLNAGADVDAVDKVGATPLSHLCMFNMGEKVRQDVSDLAQLLIQHGADVNHVDYGGQTPLSYAAVSGDTTAARILVENGADINASDPDGDQPLGSAIYAVQHELCRCLLRWGADVTNVNKLQWTTVHVLANYGDVEMLRIFTDAKMKGISIDAKDFEGRTALQLFSDRNPSSELRKAFDELLDSVEEEEEEEDLCEVGADVVSSPVESALDALDDDLFYDAKEHQ